MCIIVYCKEDIILKEKVLERMYEDNKDGIGIAVYKKGAWRVKKGIMELDDLLSYMHKMRLFDEVHPRFVIHMRKASYGKVSSDLTHPFEIKLKNSRAYLFHNGTLSLKNNYIYTIYSKYTTTKEEKSDTLILSELLSELELTKEQLLKILSEGSLLDKLRNSSRFMILFESIPHPFTIGEWRKYKKLLVSNLNFLETESKKHASTETSIGNKTSEKEVVYGKSSDIQIR